MSNINYGDDCPTCKREINTVKDPPFVKIKSVTIVNKLDEKLDKFNIETFKQISKDKRYKLPCSPVKYSNITESVPKEIEDQLNEWSKTVPDGLYSVANGTSDEPPPFHHENYYYTCDLINYSEERVKKGYEQIHFHKYKDPTLVKNETIVRVNAILDYWKTLAGTTVTTNNLLFPDEPVIGCDTGDDQIRFYIRKPNGIMCGYPTYSVYDDIMIATIEPKFSL